MNVAIIGAGKACYDLLKILDEDRLSNLNMRILGVSDVNPEAPGMLYAKKLGLFTTTAFDELFALEGLNLLIELTGSAGLKEEISKIKRPGVSIVDHRVARLIWDLIQMEMEKTELERERQHFQEKEKNHIQIILDSLPYRIMVVNMDMTIATVNQTFLKEFNLTFEDAREMPCYQARYGLNESCNEIGNACFLKERLEEIKEKGLVSTFKEYLDENGNTHFDVITIAPILDEKGQVIQLLEASRDVTERVKLEREAEKSKTFFENVIQSTVDGIVVVDTKGNVLIFNEGMERLTGYAADEIMNHGHLSSFYDMDVA
ncbi:MAG: PAS domain S-box protein, partial [Deltaproteobacteria bacterium]|nr:PAS domain S-box protein [Deltaproteobacteria bacterium]